MKCSLWTTISLLFFLWGCSTTYLVTTDQHPNDGKHRYCSYDEMTKKNYGKYVTLLLRNGCRIQGSFISVDHDSIVCQDTTTRVITSFAIVDVDQIQYVDGNYGLEGMIAGLLVGTVPLIAMGFWGGSEMGNYHTMEYPGRPLVVIGGGIGFTVGMVIGLVTHYKEYYGIERPLPDTKKTSGQSK